MDLRRRKPLHALAGAVLVFVLAASARADEINGDWCRSDGKRMTIRGREATTPGGNTVRGTVTPHSFIYVVPQGEPYAGETMSVYVLSERLAHGYLGAPNQRQIAPVQVWNRCPPGVVQAVPARLAKNRRTRAGS
jgi:hypothetical protein